MTNNRNKLLILFTAFLIFLWSEGFQLRALEFSERYKVLRISSVFLIVLWTTIRMSFADIKPLLRNFYFLSILGLLAVVMFPTFFTGTLLYGQGLDEVVKRPLFFYGLFIFVSFFYYPMPIPTLRRLNTMIVAFGVSLALFQSIFSFIPDIGRVILNDSAYIGSRFELTRMTVTSAMMPCIFYSMFYLITLLSMRKNNVLCASGLVILLYYIIFVYMSRIAIFGLGIVLLLFCVLYPVVRRRILSWGLLVLLLLILSQPLVKFGPFDIIKESAVSIIDETNSVDGTVGIRMKGIEYYWNEFHNTCYIGFGLISSVRMTDSAIGIGMAEYGFNPTDQGIISVIMQFGFQALILITRLCYQMFRDLRFVIHYGISEVKMIAISIQLLLLFRIITFSRMFLVDSQGLWWGMFFFLTWKLKDITSQRNSEGLIYD